MSLTMVVKPSGTAQVSVPTPQPTSSSLKAMAATYGGKENDDRDGAKPACKFWRSDDGCRRGAACTYYAHDTSEMRGRCFGCGGHHLKKDCPHNQKSEKGDGKKVSKVKAAKEHEKPDQVEKVVKDITGEESSKESGSPPTTSASSYRDSPPRQNRNGCCSRAV